MELSLVKADGAQDRDRVYLTDDDDTRRIAVHVIHDLPHLVVESLFRIDDGLWGELAAGFHATTNRASTARDVRQQKKGRIVSGAASGVDTNLWLSAGHRAAKTATNAVVNRWRDGPDTPAGVRARLDCEDNDAIRTLLDQVDDDTIASAIHWVRELERRWVTIAPGGTMRLTWPFDPNTL